MLSIGQTFDWQYFINEERKMEKNVGGFDRPLRITAGILILLLFFVVDGPNRWWALLGTVPLLTGLVGWCPAYTLFGIRTCKLKGR